MQLVGIEDTERHCMMQYSDDEVQYQPGRAINGGRNQAKGRYADFRRSHPVIWGMGGMDRRLNLPKPFKGPIHTEVELLALGSGISHIINTLGSPCALVV